MKLALMYDPIFLKHECGAYHHPECPERLSAALAGIHSPGAAHAPMSIPARPATETELQRVHTPEYVANVLDVLRQGGYGNLDPDTYYSSDTREAALKAVGGGIDTALAVHRREADVGLVIARPPGHHATWNRSMGFCIFNTVAAAAAALLEEETTSKVAIFDWDVHHGNGTQAQFWDSPNVLYVSIHQSPFYPGTGHMKEVGSDNARGTNVNLPLPAGACDEDYLLAMDHVIIPMIRNFKPDHILISAGFDAHADDPLAGMELTADAYREMASRMKVTADDLSHGRLTLFLEGGYSLDALEQSMAATVNGFLNPKITHVKSFRPERLHHQIIQRAKAFFRP